MENRARMFSEVKQEEDSMATKTNSSLASISSLVPLLLALESRSAFALGDGVGESANYYGGGGGGGEDMEVVVMEHLFDKMLMPSDVSKVFDWLVIPTQHAGKLTKAGKEDRQGFVDIVFEDRAVAGRRWFFKSYWSGNQIHRLTNGWGLFVREKGLHAGDTVSFFRGTNGAARGRLFIDCKHQTGAQVPPAMPATMSRRRFVGRRRDAMLYDGRRDRLGPDVPGAANTAARERQLPSLDHNGMPTCGAPPTEPPRHRRQRKIVHRDPPVTVDMPVILESSLVHLPAAKRVRLFGVYLN